MLSVRIPETCYNLKVKPKKKLEHQLLVEAVDNVIGNKWASFTRKQRKQSNAGSKSDKETREAREAARKAREESRNGKKRKKGGIST